MNLFSFGKENTPAVNKNVGKKVLHEGWLYKWTNIFGAWRKRYFILYPGSISYSIEKKSPIKETFSLSQLKIRVCPEDPVKLEIQPLDREILFLRADTITEKQAWYVAIKKAQKQYSKDCRRDVQTPYGVYSVTLPENSESENIELDHKLEILDSKLSDRNQSSAKSQSFDHTNKPPIDISELFIKTSSDLETKSPLNCMINNFLSFKEITETLFPELHLVESKTLSYITSIPQSAGSTTNRSLESTFMDLIQRIDSVEKLISNYNSSMENLLVEENGHCKQLENSLKWLAKQNYQLEKANSMTGASLSGSAEFNDRKSRADRKTKKLSSEMKAVTHERLLAQALTETNENSNVNNANSEECSSSSSYSSLSDQISNLNLGEIEDNAKNVSQSEESLYGSVVSPSSGSFEWRTKLPVPRTSLKVSLWSILKECIGKDISRIRLPVFLNEPTSFLQRSCEDFEYSQLLDRAAQLDCSVERTAWVAIFSITPYESAVGRMYKPFNPILGETFEVTHFGYDFFTEQVEHHPPLAAFDCKNENFHSYGHTFVQSKVTGKSVEVKVFGPYYIELKPKNGDEKEHYRVQRVNLIIHNIIFGTIWIEFVGTSILTNFTTGDFAIIQYLKKGWFDKEMHKIRAVVFDSKGKGRFYIHGLWSSHLYMEKIKSGTSVFFSPWKYSMGERLINKNNSFNYDKNHFKTEGDAWDSFISNINWDNIQTDKDTMKTVWKPNKKPPNNSIYYGFTYMTFQLNQLTAEYDPAQGSPIANTDSRFRPDRIAYENGELEYAGKEKTRIEDKQRAAAKARTEPYEPLYFKKVPHPITSEPIYLYNNLYWKRREEGTLNEYAPDIF